MSNAQMISKGTYKGISEKAFPLEVKEYIFARENGKKCLLLRFFNSSDVNITGISFWLIQKNVYGEHICKKKISLDGIYSLAGRNYAPSNCFFVDESCADFEVEMISAFSGEYEYRTENGESVVRYPLNLNKNMVVKRRPYSIQRSKLNKKVKHMTLILFLAIFIVSLAVIWPFFMEVVYPAIKNALSIGLDILKRAWASFLNMLGDLFGGGNA